MSDEPDATADLGSRLLLGGIAGIAATVAMTAVMHRLHARLPASEQYPLPPREISERAFAPQGDERTKDIATAAHAAYGAGSGALLAAADPAISPARGALAGVAIWSASYFGWVPVTGLLMPAHRHPPRRNALMVIAHLAWGAAGALAYRELVRARTTTLRAGPLADAPESGQ